MTDHAIDALPWATSVWRDAHPSVSHHTEVDSAATSISHTYGYSRVESNDADRKFDMRLETIELIGTRLSVLDITSARVTTVTDHDRYTICIPVVGSAGISMDREFTTVERSGGAVISPGHPVEVNYLGERSKVLTVCFPRGRINEETSAVLGYRVASDPQFALRIDEHGSGSSFYRVLRFVSHELAQSDGVTSSFPVADRLVSIMISALIASQPHTYSPVLAGPATGVPSHRSIKNVVEAINADPLQFCTLADLARFATMSASALGVVFRRHLGVSPMTYVRNVRLARAHEDLARSDPTRSTAASIAYSWGFYHYGRFARAHEVEYGVSPAALLHRTG
jgi:AraC-like DNA-binding protein